MRRASPEPTPKSRPPYRQAARANRPPGALLTGTTPLHELDVWAIGKCQYRTVSPASLKSIGEMMSLSPTPTFQGSSTQVPQPASLSPRFWKSSLSSEPCWYQEYHMIGLSWSVNKPSVGSWAESKEGRFCLGSSHSRLSIWKGRLQSRLHQAADTQAFQPLRQSMHAINVPLYIYKTGEVAPPCPNSATIIDHGFDITAISTLSVVEVFPASGLSLRAWTQAPMMEARYRTDCFRTIGFFEACAFQDSDLI